MALQGKYWLLLICLVFVATPALALNIYSNSSPQVKFAVAELNTSLRGSSLQILPLEKLPAELPDETIIIGSSNDESILRLLSDSDRKRLKGLAAEAFLLRKKAPMRIIVAGVDDAGAMYGGLELAEIIRIAGLNGVGDVEQSPYMAMRGTKFNIPLDVRTPSYTHPCDAAQNNIAEMWSWDFWTEYIDNLARYRYNFISCWSLHPFPSLVKVPDYPDVALDDVMRSTVDWQENYSLRGIGFDAPEIINNVEVIKRMTIDEKIDFWRRVMRYAKERNIDFYFVTWNIFTNGTYGKYGITDDINNETTIDYFRKSVKQMFITYPDLKGIGLTTGENMIGTDFQQREDWAFKTYARGVLDAVKEMPGRKITFIHRQHMSGALDIAEKFKPLIDHPDIEFIFSFKYAKAHVYSSTIQPYHHGFVKEIKSKGDLKTIWTLRNDDVYYFRWGAPDFVREFFQNIPYDVSRGYYYGSDQYVWGREFLTLEPEMPRQLEIVKHWYHWMLWGRLGYNPHINNARFEQILQARYPETNGGKLFEAWQNASMIYPLTTGFHWGSLDFHWYIEACKGRPHFAQTPSGFHDLNRFITLKPNAGTEYISIPDYVKAKEWGEKLSGTTPIELSDRIHLHSDKALALLDELSSGGNKELRLTLDDIRTIAYLGKYYAFKIRAATELALFRTTLERAHREVMLENLKQSAWYWRRYASLALSNNKNPLWTNRVGYVDWRKLYEYVLYDMVTAGGDRKVPSMPVTKGGTILEAEEAQTFGRSAKRDIPGFTGSGFIDMSDVGKTAIEWTFNAPQEGRYILEFRYTLARDERFPAKMMVNEKDAGELVFWTVGDKGNWVWDRKIVRLKRGRNTILLKPDRKVILDHMNVIFTGEL